MEERLHYANMFYTKQYFWTELFFTENCCFISEVTARAVTVLDFLLPR